jgi:hypothetical protein
MLFVGWFKFDPDHTDQVREKWKHFKYPEEAKVVGRYILIGRHMSVAIVDVPNEETLLKITGPFSTLGVVHFAPAMPLEEAIQVTW